MRELLHFLAVSQLTEIEPALLSLPSWSIMRAFHRILSVEENLHSSDVFQECLRTCLRLHKVDDGNQLVTEYDMSQRRQLSRLAFSTVLAYILSLSYDQIIIH